MKKVLFLVLMLTLSLCASAAAEIPQYLSYQGVLTNASGAAVPDGRYELTFRLYLTEKNGFPMWSEIDSVTVSKGIFNAILGGSSTLTSLLFDRPYYLGISVEGGAELEPRTLLTASAYSLNSQRLIGESNIVPSNGHVGIGTLSPARNVDIRENVNSVVGIMIENRDYGGGSTERIDFADEHGTVAAISLYDDSNIYSSQMRIFNNRPGGSIHLMAGLGSISVQESGYCGVGLTYPNERLDVNGGVRIGNTDNSNAGTIRWTGSDFEGHDGLTWKSLTGAGSGLPAGTAGATLRHDGNDWISNTFLYNDGTKVSIGSSAQSGELEFYRAGVTPCLGRLYTSVSGGNLSLFDDAGNQHTILLSDSNGEGGYFGVYRDVSAFGFRVDGNYSDTHNPLVNIFGTAGSMSFNPGVSGDGSANLQNDAISSEEMLNEPGVVTYTEGFYTTTLTPTLSTIGSQTITVPAAGYVLVLATAQWDVFHANGTPSDARAGVSDVDNALPENQDIRIAFPAAAPSGNYAWSQVASSVFSVAGQGSYTYYFLGEEDSGDIRVADVQLTCLYIPTAYGTVEPAAVDPRASNDANAPPRPAINVATQRAESVAANEARIERELAAMRERIAALERELERE
jgi:hypothetical protein